MTGIAQVIENDGMVPQQSSSTFFASGSPRRRGVMQGVFFFLLTFLVVPITNEQDGCDFGLGFGVYHCNQLRSVFTTDPFFLGLRVFLHDHAAGWVLRYW